jgi:hypothetical protein
MVISTVQRQFWHGSNLATLVHRFADTMDAVMFPAWLLAADMVAWLCRPCHCFTSLHRWLVEPLESDTLIQTCLLFKSGVLSSRLLDHGTIERFAVSPLSTIHSLLFNVIQGEADSCLVYFWCPTSCRWQLVEPSEIFALSLLYWTITLMTR